VSAPDFEINARIGAKRLVPHVAPHSQTRTEGEEVTLVRGEHRSGVPATIEPGERYSDLVIEKRLVGETRHFSGERDAEKREPGGRSG